MNDTRERLRPLDLLESPDMWEESTRRLPRTLDEHETARHRRPILAVAILAVVVAVLGSVFLGLGRLGQSRAPAGPGPGEIVRYRFDSPPQPIAVGEGAAWVSVGGEGSHLRSIDAGTGEQRSTDVPGGEWPAVGGGSVWFICNSACGGGTILQIDPDTAEVVDSFASGGGASQVAGAPDGVWFTAETGVSFISSAGDVRTISNTAFNLIGVDGQNLWVSSDSGITRLDQQTGEELARVPFDDVCNMEVADGMVWMASCRGGLFPGSDADRLMGIDGSTGEVLFDRAIEGHGQMRYADGVLWLAQNDPKNQSQIRILRFDPRTGKDLGDPISIPHGEEARFLMSGFSGPHVFFAVGEGSLWVTDYGAGEVIRVGIPQTPDAGDQVTVPDLVGLPITEAIKLAEEAGLTVETIQVLDDSKLGEPGADEVQSQDPLPGTDVDEGTSISVAVIAIPHSMPSPVTPTNSADPGSTPFAQGSDPIVGPWRLFTDEREYGPVLGVRLQDDRPWTVELKPLGDRIFGTRLITGAQGIDNLDVQVVTQSVDRVEIRMDDGTTIQGELVDLPQGLIGPGQVFIAGFRSKITVEGQQLDPDGVVIAYDKDGNELDRRSLSGN